MVLIRRFYLRLFICFSVLQERGWKIGLRVDHFFVSLHALQNSYSSNKGHLWYSCVRTCISNLTKYSVTFYILILHLFTGKMIPVLDAPKTFVFSYSNCWLLLKKNWIKFRCNYIVPGHNNNNNNTPSRPFFNCKGKEKIVFREFSLWFFCLGHSI